MNLHVKSKDALKDSLTLSKSNVATLTSKSNSIVVKIPRSSNMRSSQLRKSYSNNKPRVQKKFFDKRSKSIVKGRQKEPGNLNPRLTNSKQPGNILQVPEAYQHEYEIKIKNLPSLKSLTRSKGFGGAREGGADANEKECR